MSCPLCDMEEVTRWYYQDERFIICDCKTCGPDHPMVVYRLHGKWPTQEEKLTILNIASKVLKKPVQFRGYMRSIKDHWHDHLEGVQ